MDLLGTSAHGCVILLDKVPSDLIFTSLWSGCLLGGTVGEVGRLRRVLGSGAIVAVDRHD